MEGAGVLLKRAFGQADSYLDPFLLLDDFHSSDPKDYLSGFPWHPHRGIETITYMLNGELKHGDSLGNEGVIGSGDVQWMTAGSGIIHEEMPKGQKNGLMWGLQLWANLPASYKMMDPRYREIKKINIPELILDNQIKIKIIAGQLNGIMGPVQDVVSDPEYFDVYIPPKTEFNYLIKKTHNAFAYIIGGKGYFDNNKSQLFGKEHLIIFEHGDKIMISTGSSELRFLLISGEPIQEPVAWYGPIVMNTEEELRIAFQEYRDGTFIKHKIIKKN
ncbi:MAG: pirin family protein [Candidatus Lokiarchaeota archaeon]|nr:pirin family protein [Candidatus Lokiarchaeota archaeon]